MSIENQNDKPGASGDNPPVTPPPTPAPKTEPKFEAKDGSYFVDGKKVVAESDLIAAKKGLESQIQTQQTTHSQAMDAIQLDLSAERENVADLTAKLTTAQNAQGEGAVSAEEIARIKQEHTEALAKVDALTTQAGKALELKKSLLIAKYPGVTAEQLNEKTMEQLDSLEEALKTVITAKGGGIGPYAAGGGLGGAQPMSDYDRRKAAMESAKVGARTAQTQ